MSKRNPCEMSTLHLHSCSALRPLSKSKKDKSRKIDWMAIKDKEAAAEAAEEAAEQVAGMVRDIKDIMSGGKQAFMFFGMMQLTNIKVGQFPLTIYWLPYVILTYTAFCLSYWSNCTDYVQGSIYILAGSGNSSDGVTGALKKALKDLSKKPAPQQGIWSCMKLSLNHNYPIQDKLLIFLWPNISDRHLRHAFCIYWSAILKILKSCKMNIIPQIAAGAGAGWVTGYLTMKVGKVERETP